MKPILYKNTETDFGTNGIGILADALKCNATEERNGMFELEMRYPITGVHYANIALRSLITAKPNPVDDPQPFRVYRITKPLNGIVTVYARHISYDLAGIPAQPFTASSSPAAMQALKNNAVTPCPFTFWTDKTTTATMTNSTPQSIRSLLGGVRGSVLDVYGGEYAFDRYTVRLYNARGADRGVSIRYGKNLTSLEQDENCAAVYTGVYPYWTDSDGNLMQLPEKIVNASGTYNFVRILPLDLSSEWQEQPTEAQLRTRAQRYITENNIGVPKVSLSISFVQLEQYEEYKHLAMLERVSLCDTVNVEFPRLGVSATAKVYKTVYDVLRDRWETVDLGDTHTTLADTIASQGEKIAEAQKQTKTFLQQAIDSATALITGNKGGYVILHSSTGSKDPDEILIMDTPDIRTAKKVWRWNKAGLGYSSTGYNGPYGLAMTQDGQIVADYIATGTLNAALMTAGVLQSRDGKTFYLDLESGVLRMQAESLSIGGKTVGAIAQAAVDGQSQEDVFNKLTGGSAQQGIYISNGNLYLNASYLKTGTLNADLIKTGTLNGKLVEVTDISASNIKTGTLNANLIKAGTLNAGLIGVINLKAQSIVSGILSSVDNMVRFDLDNAEITLKERNMEGSVPRATMSLEDAKLNLISGFGGVEQTAARVVTGSDWNGGNMRVYKDGQPAVEVAGRARGGRIAIGDATGAIRATMGIRDDTGRFDFSVYNSSGVTIYQVYETDAGNIAVYQKTS